MKKVMAFIFILSIGILILVARQSIKQIDFINSSVSATGTIVDFEESYSKDSDGNRSVSYFPIFQFVDNQEQVRKVKSNVGSNPPAYEKGDEIEILYDPLNSNHAKINTFFSMWLGEMIFGIIGILLFLISISYFYYQFKKNKLKRQMLTSGRQIEAKINTVEQNTALSVRGRSPYIIYCQWQDSITSNHIYLFESENIWFDPSPFIDKETITVYIDEANPKRYYVDISFLPKVK
ncbi:DUF3592 domain-containing protein [uncultured Gilliamella sp.]|uniref:DUF3592 domain-containing protein n=1 Tax=uncultured Gilliamella sp. TaxID=1193505 RepID=UPI0025E6CDBA|nr:DUF3592 domain-containing protein [uncultured Gilliamella sp.]